MKNAFIGLVVLLSTVAIAAPKQRAVVYVDHFIPVPGANCQIKDNEIQILQDRIVGNVTSSRKYEVVERENLAKVQKELKLVDAGMTEGAAPESNKLKAAGYCVYGKIIQYRHYVNQASVGGLVANWLFGTIEIQIRITNIENGQILAAKTIKKQGKKGLTNAVATSQNLELEVMTEALDKAAKEVVIELNNVAFPVYVTDADGKFLTGNISAEQVTVGDIWEVWKRRGPKINPETEEMEGYREKLVCQVRVSRPGPKETKFECLNKQDGQELEELFDSISSLPVQKMREKGLIMRKAPDSLQDSEDGVAKPQKKPSLSEALGGF